MNLALAQGNIGKPGAGLLPVRGHSNVQGDRTMGICERPPAHFLDALAKEFTFQPPRENGLDVVDTIRALRDGKAHFFMGLGGNFVQAAPDTDVVVEAMQRARASIIRLVGAVLAEQHDEWAEGRRYLGVDVLTRSQAGTADPATEPIPDALSTGVSDPLALEGAAA